VWRYPFGLAPHVGSVAAGPAPALGIALKNAPSPVPEGEFWCLVFPRDLSDGYAEAPAGSWLIASTEARATKATKATETANRRAIVSVSRHQRTVSRRFIEKSVSLGKGASAYRMNPLYVQTCQSAKLLSRRRVGRRLALAQNRLGRQCRQCIAADGG
jgi:hypothetical protein